MPAGKTENESKISIIHKITIFKFIIYGDAKLFIIASGSVLKLFYLKNGTLSISPVNCVLSLVCKHLCGNRSPKFTARPTSTVNLWMVYRGPFVVRRRIYHLPR